MAEPTTPMTIMKDAMEYANSACRESKNCRSEIDIKTASLPPEMQPAMNKLSEALTNVIKRQNQIAESLRKEITKK